MNDALGRSINYLRLSITDRCNLRCHYCMPSTGIDQVNCREILRFEDFLRIVEAASELGIRKVRITGGEPLVRKGVIEFIDKVARIPNIDEVTLTTNGLLLSGQTQALFNAGVKRLNVSLDSLQPVTFREITRGGDLPKVLQGLEEAEKTGMQIKLNMVVIRGINDQEIIPFAALSQQKDWSVRFIEYMPTIREPQWRKQIVTSREILSRLKSQFELHSLPSSRLSGPAKPYRIAKAPGTIGIISPMSEHFCGSCNRIRVTSTGFARGCLLSAVETDLKVDLQSNDQKALISTLRDVITHKPAEHLLSDNPKTTTVFSMATIGG